jgi:putative radical SAM enzyme (TIGR03279 family)
VSKPRPGTIASLSPGSVAEELGLQPGDRLLAVDGRALADVIDFRYLTAKDQFELLVERDGEQTLYDIVLDGGELLGIEFEEPLFDGLRRCRNRCPFCFVRQLPHGLRRTLHVRDDDFRYSFLYGNFITLTNLGQADWQRLAEQRLSPLYVSVHATDQATRDRMLGIREDPPILAKLDWLRQHGLRYHAQLVLVPGINDGPNLDRSLADLLAQGEAMLSVSAVPVGLTAYSPPGARTYAQGEARAVLRQLKRWRLRYARETGSARVYASDEWFLVSGTTIPSARYYADFPQIENGVGLVRLFLEGWKRTARRLRAVPMPSESRLVICGKLIAPVWQQIAEEMNGRGANVTVLPVANRALGETVTVSGLLFARDVLAAIDTLGDQQRPAAVCLPRSMFNAEGTLTLDGLSLAEISARAGLPVIVGAEAADILCPLPA